MDEHEEGCEVHCLAGHCNCETEDCAESRYELLCDAADIRRKQMMEDAMDTEVK